jgi:hypothetical protein
MRHLLVHHLLRRRPAHSGGPSGSAEPCQTTEGQQCFESWISEYARLANNYYGSPDCNGRKPWYINQYGLMAGGGAGGPYSPYAPDDFAQYCNNKYCWTWAHSGNYQGPDQIAASLSYAPMSPPA